MMNDQPSRAPGVRFRHLRESRINRLRGISVAILTIATAACAAPLVRPNPPALQAKVDHAINWQQLAKRAVEKLPTTLHSERPRVFVDIGSTNSQFATVYKKFLEQALYERDYPVQNTPLGAGMVLKINTSWLLYARDHQKPIGDYATLYTTAIAVGAQFRHVSSLDTGLGIGLIAGPVIDFLAAMNGTTNAEVILTTTVEDNTNIHYLGSETYYVEPSDLAFYLPQAEPRGFPVVPLRVIGGYR